MEGTKSQISSPNIQTWDLTHFVTGLKKKSIFLFFRVFRTIHNFKISSFKLSYDLMVLSTDGHIRLQSCCTAE